MLSPPSLVRGLLDFEDSATTPEGETLKALLAEVTHTPAARGSLAPWGESKLLFLNPSDETDVVTWQTPDICDPFALRPQVDFAISNNMQEAWPGTVPNECISLTGQLLPETLRD